MNEYIPTSNAITKAAIPIIMRTLVLVFKLFQTVLSSYKREKLFCHSRSQVFMDSAMFTNTVNGKLAVAE